MCVCERESEREGERERVSLVDFSVCYLFVFCLLFFVDLFHFSNFTIKGHCYTSFYILHHLDVCIIKI